MTRKTALLLTMSTALALSTACSSTLTGNEGNFEFSYPTDDKVLDFNKPVAVGAQLELTVKDVGARLPVDLSEASSDDAAIMDVVSFGDDKIVLEGTGDGNMLLSVAGTTAGGETLTDSVNMNAATPEVHELIHTCARQDTEAAYLTDHRVFLEFELEKANGQPTIGWGYYPVDLSDTLATVNESESGQLYMAVDTGSKEGSFDVVSAIDGTTATMTLVKEKNIDGVAEPVAWVWEDIDAGDTNAFYVLPKSGDLTICQAEANKTVVSDTPEICDVRDRDAAEDSLEFGWFEVEGKAEGMCKYTVTYTASGASAQFEYPIEP